MVKTKVFFRVLFFYILLKKENQENMIYGTFTLHTARHGIPVSPLSSFIPQAPLVAPHHNPPPHPMPTPPGTVGILIPDQSYCSLPL